jgi:phosphonate transport system substrate-binding protein
MKSRRLVLAQLFWFVTGCALSGVRPADPLGQLTVGTVAYGEGSQSAEQYQRFVQYLESQLKALVQLEPAFNEVQALEQIQRQAWSLVFAPPGLAAIAVSKAQYLPLFPLQGVDHLSSVLVTLADSPMQTLADVNGAIVALGQPGSATGYYVPLYELYGTTPAEVRLAPTPQTILTWLAEGEAEVGALSKDEFERYRSGIRGAQFKVLHASRRIPSGSVLISPKVDRNQQAVIQKAMEDALPAIADEAGYIPNVAPPDYKTLIAFIEKVEPIKANINQKPAPLYSN